MGSISSPSAFHQITSVLRKPEFVLSRLDKRYIFTVLRAHSREGHLQYLQSLEADLADSAQVDGEDAAEESVAASSVDKDVDACSCELGIRYPTLQAILTGKLNKQSIQANIMYSIIVLFMISLVISPMIYRYRAGKPMQELQKGHHTIILLARSAWMCIS